MRVHEMEHELVPPGHDLVQNGHSTEIMTCLAMLLVEAMAAP